MIIDLTKTPQNLYCNIYRTGMDNGVKVKNLQWDLQVLAFVQPNKDNKDWYIVTFRTDMIKSPVNNYYTDTDTNIDYQLYYIGCQTNTWDTDKDNISRVQIYKGEKESYDEMLEDMYPRVRKLYEDMDKDEKYTDNSLYEYLVQHKKYVNENMPHILL